MLQSMGYGCAPVDLAPRGGRAHEDLLMARWGADVTAPRLLVVGETPRTRS